MNTFPIVTLALLVPLLAACATPGGERPEFGASVRHVIEAQTYESDGEVPSLSGDKAAAAMERYRTDTGDPRRFGRGTDGL
ncbi:hypothetical protein [Aquisalimonas sp.]|uniref:hypothetical protein n=1 Tax=Aquisalimonas sp. TaxID=1872621 RepID=UPI0025C4D789|nr:hypothetical protein [Aquisalimonas sp.]